MGNGLGDLMKQAQKMQDNIKKAQGELADMRVEGASGAGLVSVVMTGRYEIVKVNIDPSLFEAHENGKVETEDREMVEDLLAAAVNDAVHKIEGNSKGKMAGLMEGISLPEDFQLPVT